MQNSAKLKVFKMNNVSQFLHNNTQNNVTTGQSNIYIFLIREGVCMRVTMTGSAATICKEKVDGA